MVNDPIADFLTRIRNAQQRKHAEIVVPSTKMLEAIASILKEEGFILGYDVEESKPQNKLKVQLKYVADRPAIQELTRVSRPGVRQYYGYKDIDRVMRGLGISIFSTPKGVMTGEKARQEHVGGEYLCRIW